MIKYRSSKVTHGRNMAGARALWRATGMNDEDFKKPIIAIVNSFSEFVPGHIHLREIGKLVSKEIRKSGGIGKEFNTIAIDDGIAMGHSGMLYSLPSRELIADSIEYMINAHCVDAMICISNCDKITPAMLMAALRINIPTIFVSGGPMESGKIIINQKKIKLDLVDVIAHSVNPNVSNNVSKNFEKLACPTCGSCSGMFTANSMNCLTEALGLAQPGNGSLLATHYDRKKLFVKGAKQIVQLTKLFYEEKNVDVLPRNIATKLAFENAMMVDIAMGGSTNTVLHLLAAANEGKIYFNMQDIDKISKKIPHLCKVSPSTNKYHMEDVHRAGGVIGILGELDRSGFLNHNVKNILGLTLKETLKKYDIMITKSKSIKKMFRASPAGIITVRPFSQNSRWKTLDNDRKNGCIRSYKYAFSKYGGLTILYGNLAKDGCILKTASIKKNLFVFNGPAKVYDSQENAVYAILNGKIVAGDVIIIRYEGPKGGPGMQEMLYPTTYLKSMGLSEKCALITDGRFSGGTSGLSIGHISPEASNKGNIALINNGDLIDINIFKRTINVLITKKEMNKRRFLEEQKGKYGYKPYTRDRKVSFSLYNYSLFVSSADKGAIREKKIEVF